MKIMYLCVTIVGLTIVGLMAQGYRSISLESSEKTGPFLFGGKNANTIEAIIKKAESFPMDDVLERYKQEYHVDDTTARRHKEGLIHFFALSTIKDKLPMVSKKVDNYWHTFLLFTKDYARFCKEVCGTFIHHVPKVGKEEPSENERQAVKDFVTLYTESFGSQPPVDIWGNAYEKVTVCEGAGWCNSVCKALDCGTCDSSNE